ncbi:hypothetical protein [Nannocystis sp. SCPEA4]|uniref:hypothetical protein n=1 Tax=Nannocystis sp. SCPEA4 TaxID=2996787 RepID=UPI00227095B1|nr:hypothetical protein [Nannocystis sp. SCPEA4]MCY1061446.1 hypothetical protein [Nannocystis sp. SCPEA4]
MKLTNLLTSALCGGLVLFAAGEAMAAEAKIPMVTFFSAARGDHITTSDPTWTCRYFNNCPAGSGDPTGGYVAVGMQGHVWNPDNPQPTGTNKLYHWWNPTRGDNFITSDPAWDDPTAPPQPGYTMFRIEGYAAQSGPLQLQLRSYWNPGTEDNAALTTWHYGANAGYSHYRTEGYLLPPDDATCSGAPTHIDPTSWLARGNYMDSWPQPNNFVSGDRVMFTAPQESYTVDYWGTLKPVRGNFGSAAVSSYPAPGRQEFALLATVTTGRAYVGSGWYEAGKWFIALGEHYDWNGPCIFYDATGVTPGELQTRFNDPILSDNSGGANVKIRHWRP